MKKLTREERKEKLKERMKSNVANRDAGGGSQGQQYLKFSSKKPEFYTPKEGKNKIDIIPYIVSTKNHPQNIGIGEEDYILDIWVHRFVGMKKDNFICLQKSYGKPCPICEERKKLYDLGDEKLAESIKPQRRAIYNVIDLTDDKEKVLIFDTSYALFEKEMLEELQTFSEDEEIPAIADLDDGKSITFRGSEQTFGKNKYLEFKSFDFVDRKNAYDDEILDNVFNLDAAINLPTYEQVSQSFFGMEEENDEDQEEEKPVRKNKPVEVEENEEEDEKPKKATKTNKCPNGLTFGDDFDMDDVCEDCEIRKECKKG